MQTVYSHSCLWGAEFLRQKKRALALCFPKDKPPTLVEKRCSKWGSDLKGFKTPLKAALLQISTYYWLLHYTKLIYGAKSSINTNSKRNWQTSAGAEDHPWNCSVWSGTSALASFPSFSAHQDWKRDFYTAHQGRQGQKLIRTIHKAGWRSAASHPWKFNCTQQRKAKTW